MTDFSGIVPPVVTPLTKDGKLDKESYKRHLERMIAAGVDGLFVLGSSSEVAFLTDEMRREVLKTAVEIVDHRVPVLGGCIDTETMRVIEHAKEAKELGVDAIVATAPFYALGGLAEIERHFRLIHQAIDLPLFAYDIPVCVHVKLPVDLIIRLGKDGVLSGVKDSSGDDVSFRFLCQENRDCGHTLTLLTVHEVVVDGSYMSGADGCVHGLGNVDPEGYVRQWRAYQHGDWETVRKEQDYLARLMRITAVPSGIQGYGAGVGGFKTALQLLGVFNTNQVTEPVKALEGENVERVRTVLEQVGLLK